MGQYFSGIIQYTCITAVLLYGLGWIKGESIADKLYLDDSDYTLLQDSLTRKVPFYELGIIAGYEKQHLINSAQQIQ
ncbi:hypothetical protein L2735_11685 [Shewanella olleyana]|uniref:hypothetical protein n=1 Tax=Shewanella olleyana TaxID=135626 RepID=UPI00200D609B|nr:hypothetical protein [Shewanella olleyana]MCL1067463.1 hypothetical protein [Shewanella olleyana]